MPDSQKDKYFPPLCLHLCGYPFVVVFILLFVYIFVVVFILVAVFLFVDAFILAQAIGIAVGYRPGN